MANYSSAEILSEVSQVFRSSIDPGKEGGTLNTKVEYGQLMESASLTFLLNNDAIFYIAGIVRNRLLDITNQEIQLLEDTLIAIDNLGQIGQPVRDTTILSNAQTALLALDAASTIQGRPEARRFNILMDSYAELHRKNIISQVTGQLVRPREEARGVIRTNLKRLKTTHDRLLEMVFSLDELVDQYIELNIPLKVSTTALTNVRNNLQELEDDAGRLSDPESISASRASVLTSLVSKTAVGTISEFSDPRSVKIRTPIAPIPSNLKHRGRVTGNGEPPTVLSSQGPWDLPLSTPLVLAINGSSQVSLDVDEILGSASQAIAIEPFDLDSSHINLHVIVDPRAFIAVVTSGSTTSATLDQYLSLTYKSLGAPISFTDLVSPNNESRAISDLQLLQTGTISAAASIGGERWQVTFSGWAAGAEGGLGLGARHVGMYFRDSGNDRWEILQVLDANNAVVSVPTILPTAVNPPTTGSLFLQGDVPGLNTVVSFQPATALVANGGVLISSSIKTAQLSISPNNTVAGAINDIQNEAGAYDPALGNKTWRAQTLNQYIQVQENSLYPGQILLVSRSADSYITVSDRFIRIDQSIGVSIIENSAHEQLGLSFGQGLSGSTLSVADLASYIEGNTTGLIASVDSVTVTTGALTASAGTSEVADTNLDGVAEIRDELVLPRGTFRILSLSPIIVDTLFSATATLDYRLIRTKMRLETVNTSRGSSLEIISGPSELRLPIGLVKGLIPTFEAIDQSGNQLEFTGVVPGDILDIAGLPEVDISGVSGILLTLSIGLPSDVVNKAFEIRGKAARQYDSLTNNLDTFINSRQLLKKHGFDKNLDALDHSLTLALLPGQSFIANRNQARKITADLLSILTDSPRRSDEYSADIPQAALNLEDILSQFQPSVVSEVDSLLDMFLERKYNRAARLLQKGKVQEFFSTNEETGSYSGSVMKSSKSVVKDLPSFPNTAEEVDLYVNVATNAARGDNAEINLSDSELISGGSRR